ncbi:MAG: NADH-quinone oxidoreductase subunit L [Phycisphaerales bacterium]|nr:NADH-quinone oxidoreductase subunit L [Phycisphaerales bacterium]
MTLLDAIPTLSTLASGGAEHFAYHVAEAGPKWMALVPGLPLLGAVICLAMLLFKRDMGGRSRVPAYLVTALLGISFVVTLIGFLQWNHGQPWVVHAFEWINVAWGSGAGQSLQANASFYMDGLSWLWMLFVTGLGAAICLYASEYMANDKGYARFFSAFALFVVSMSCLVMGDNLVMLYLGWEGVGLCSYLLIGYFYTKPSAVAAAKKAFIVNRIGDLGLALGLYLTFTTFGTVQYDELFAMVSAGVDGSGHSLAGTWQATWIPLLLMIGAFGKSAQFPLYVWLPDAMEGPTPVSALIHAATMVTAGVYLIARMYPLFLMDEALTALHVVAYVGTFTAFLAATIGMAQFDIKRIMAYSTLSQLGYMFAGLGVLTTNGAAYHVFTHAFFKATLFLACGAVMHGFAGQLDLRKLSGLWNMKGWRIVSVAMLVGCLNLSGIPVITAGFWSKDMIIAEAFTTPNQVIAGSSLIGWVLLITAGMTAYYTFRVFFRVFVGPVEFEPGDEAHGHGDDDDHGHGGDDHGHAGHDAHGHGDGHFHPHAPGWAINFVLAALAIGSTVAILPNFMGDHGWVGGLLHDSTAFYQSGFGHHEAPAGEHALANSKMEVVPVAAHSAPAHGAPSHDSAPDAHAAGEVHANSFLGMNAHAVMYYVSTLFGLAGLAFAAYLHGPVGAWSFGIGNRTKAAVSRADGWKRAIGPIGRWAEHKWYVDEFYDLILRTPLRVIAHIFHAFDKLIIDGALVDGAGLLPRLLGRTLRPMQSGVLHGYATGMAAGIGIIVLIVLVMTLS